MAKTKTKTKDYYEVLGVPPRSHVRVIEESYWERAHSLQSMPTRKAQQRLGALNEAYETLGSPHKRAEYDRRRDVHAAAAAGTTTGLFHTLISLIGKPFRLD
jgi:curved DNA-binding protein CbpA